VCHSCWLWSIVQCSDARHKLFSSNVQFNWSDVLRPRYTALQFTSDGKNRLNRTVKNLSKTTGIEGVQNWKKFFREYTTTAAGWWKPRPMVPPVPQSPPSLVRRCRLQTRHSPQLQCTDAVRPVSTVFRIKDLARFLAQIPENSNHSNETFT